jgi:hypothetical protein
MSDGPTFAEIIVPKLGTPKEPVGLGDVLFLALLLGGVGAYLALEQGLAQLLRRLLRSPQTEAQNQQEPPREE